MNRKLFMFIAFLFVLLLCVSRSPERLFSDPEPGDWPQLQMDAQRSGRTSAFVPPEYRAAWAWMDKNHIVRNFISEPGKSITDGFEPGFRVTVLFSREVQPIVCGGVVYVGAMDGAMYAIDALTGDNRWDFVTQGPILGTAACEGENVIFGSMDGNVYAVGRAGGGVAWSYTTGAGVNAAPAVFDGAVYVGSRDGVFYSLDAASGSLRWRYQTRVEPEDPQSPFNLAPIMAPAALSEDGLTVFFGAENMFFYALDAATGQERWAPRKLVGQSFLMAWPVAKDGRVFVRTMSSLKGAESGVLDPDIETLLDGLPESPSWDEEKAAILGYLVANPQQKSMAVFDAATGEEPYQAAMGRVTGNNFTPFPPVADSQGRLLNYWRSKRSTFFQDSGTFGTKYCPDISALDPATGDRQVVSTPAESKMSCPELDNGFALSSGGDWLYLHNDFRGTKAINVVTGSSRGISAPIAVWDGAGHRGGTGDGIWGFQIIYYGNENGEEGVMPTPPLAYLNASGYSAVAIASVSGKSMLFVNEGDAYAIVGIEQKP